MLRLLNSKFNWGIRTRIVTGVLLYAYVVTHLLNHALGIISLEAMEQGRLIFLAFWRSPLMNILFPLATLLHVFMAGWALLQRNSLKEMKASEWLQYGLGFSIPFFLIGHAVGTQMLHEVYGVDDTYSLIVMMVWSDPINIFLLLILLTITMFHGSLGMYYYLRLKKWFYKWKQSFVLFSVVLSLLGTLGFVAAGKEVEFRSQMDPNWEQQVMDSTNFDFALFPLLLETITLLLQIYGGGLVFVLVARLGYLSWKRKRNPISITYPHGKTVAIHQGISVLDASNQAKVPHAQICRGKGRCSTCRVFMLEGEEHLNPPNEDEQKVLQRVQAPSGVRLACQAYPHGPIRVEPLFPTDISVIEGVRKQKQFLGKERELVILFADIRGFTSFSEHRLPYDVVSILNRYFQATGTTIERNRGYLDKFIGDGIMAIFGIEDGPEQGAIQAIETAKGLVQEVNKINDQFSVDLENPMRIGLGIHCGKVIIGEMGYKHTLHLTAIGDTVNTASRLESYTKDFGCELILSDEVARHTELNFSKFQRHDLAIRGRKQSLSVWAIPEVKALQSKAVE